MDQREFSRLAIAGRGEPAMRVIHAVRELNHGRADPVHLIALHTEAERDALFVRHADEAVCVEFRPGRPGARAGRRARRRGVGRVGSGGRAAGRCGALRAPRARVRRPRSGGAATRGHDRRQGAIRAGRAVEAVQRGALPDGADRGRWPWQRCGPSESATTRVSGAGRRCSPNPRARPSSPIRSERS